MGPKKNDTVLETTTQCQCQWLNPFFGSFLLVISSCMVGETLGLLSKAPFNHGPPFVWQIAQGPLSPSGCVVHVCKPCAGVFNATIDGCIWNGGTIDGYKLNRIDSTIDMIQLIEWGFHAPKWVEKSPLAI